MNSLHGTTNTTSPPRVLIAGGKIHDPANQRDGIVADIWIEDGRIVDRPIDPAGFTRIDARGLVVMPGGVLASSLLIHRLLACGVALAAYRACRRNLLAGVGTGAVVLIVLNAMREY